MAMNIGTYTLALLSYTGKEFQVPPTSGMGWRTAVSIDVENRRFMPYFEALPHKPGTMPSLLTLDLCSTRPKLLTHQERKPRFLLS